MTFTTFLFYVLIAYVVYYALAIVFQMTKGGVQGKSVDNTVSYSAAPLKKPENTNNTGELVEDVEMSKEAQSAIDEKKNV